MKKTIYSDNISPKCLYCETGVVSPDGNSVLCVKKGVMMPDSFCRKFRYDPLKRTPETVKLNTDFTPDDFSL